MGSKLCKPWNSLVGAISELQDLIFCATVASIPPPMVSNDCSAAAFINKCSTIRGH